MALRTSIVCPICLEEPQKGVRHVCQKPAEMPPPSDVSVVLVGQIDQRSLRMEQNGERGIEPGIARRTGSRTTATSFEASISSLVSKNCGLWRSKRALCRCKGEDFFVAVLFEAFGDVAYRKDPKRALIIAIHQVREEAAKALQVPRNAFRDSMHYPILWRVHAMH